MRHKSGGIAHEFDAADLGDHRLDSRLVSIAELLVARPCESLPRAMQTPAALEAIYRFMSNRRVTPSGILEPHIGATRARMLDEDRVLVIHDTTEFSFGGVHDRGLGRHHRNTNTLFAHFALAASASDGRPLGVLDIQTWCRAAERPGKKVRNSYAYKTRSTHEGQRWRAGVANVSEHVDSSKVIHVMDREGDQYLLMAEIERRAQRFVIRASHKDRILVGDDAPKLGDKLGALEFFLERTVSISSRAKKRFRPTGQREGRTCKLRISAGTTSLRRAWPLRKDTPAHVTVNVVHVIENRPPRGEEPVEWILVTNLPVATKTDVAFVVDSYRRRWQIEELFKAIKTGCRYEKLQLESYEALVNALATIAPIAWQMLLLRQQARSSDPIKASSILNDAQLGALRASVPTLPRSPTAQQALVAIATLGGHIKNNGEAGWLVIYRGFRDLMLMEIGWRLRSDQS